MVYARKKLNNSEVVEVRNIHTVRSMVASVTDAGKEEIRIINNQAMEKWLANGKEKASPSSGL